MSDTTDSKFKEEVKYSLSLLRQPPVLMVLLAILVLLIFAAVAA